MDHTQAILHYQPLLQRIAYNLVRCKADAEDIVQETFLKWLTIGPKKIENIKAYLVKAVTNNCLNHIQKLQRKKEEVLSSINIKEVINRVIESNFAHLDFDIQLAAAIKVLHTKLEPLERAVFLLKEIFDFDYDALQVMLERKKEHCRQLFCRAKKKLKDGAQKSVEPADKSGFIESFRKACHIGEVTDFIGQLKKDITVSLSKKN